MATTLFFDGRLISIPGSYSTVDATGLESIGLGATGIVAIIGEAEGGIPVSEISDTDDFIRITKPESALQIFRSGPLREAIPFAFAPSSDPDIPGGAVEVVAMKVNPATGSSATFSNAYGDSLTLTSVDYGAFTTQINVTIADGTNQGKLLTITFEDTVESVDDLGGDSMFDLTYVDSGTGWDTMTAEVESGGAIVCDGTKAEAGLDSQITAQPSAASVLTAVSSSGSDTALSLYIYGINAAGTAAVSETLTLTGATPVTGSTSFSVVSGARVVGTTIGTITITDDDPATILTLAPGANPKGGLAACADVYVGGDSIDVVADGASTADVVLVGLSTTGAAQLEQLTLNGATPVNGTATWSEITFIGLGDVAAARTLTFSGEAARTVPATHDTLQKCADYFNARSTTPVATTYGFIFTINTGLTSFDPADLDNTTDGAGAVSCLSPTTPDFYADLWAIIDWVTYNSNLVSAAAASGAAGGAPSNTTAPVFLSGGAEGSTSNSDWQDALNFLKRIRVSTIVVLTHTPAVHAMVDAHCAYMCGQGRNERDAVVGLLNSGGTDLATKTEIKSQIIDLNTRHIRAVAQAVTRYNTDGEREEFDPPYLAAVIAGMQAGSTVGTSLTFKLANALAVRSNSGASGWHPVDDSEEMIQAGLCFLETVDGLGRRVVRNITTHLSSNNLAYTEASVNEAVNFAAYNFRTNMEVSVGKKGFAGTVNAAKGVAVNTLGLLVDEQVLVAWQGLNVELSVDVLEVSVQMAPVIPINFVANTIHLIVVQQQAT